MYAIIACGGKQYRVAEGDLVRVERLAAGAGSEVEFREVLLVKTDQQTYIGRPLVAGATVRGVVEGEGRSDKVLVFKYKKKKQYRRTRGHRQDFQDVRIASIRVGE
ncbi:MAG: 50S ribosomal protein L21 [Acidobacteria bacterium]|nr:MAG: 50S ribosomal protein L21 [Acidobacteriota bacterium]